jgi:pilus assembly protein Flp/PilA
MKRIREKFASLRASRRGATAIEYGLIVSLIALGAMGGIQAFGGGLSNMWGYVADEVLKAS